MKLKRIIAIACTAAMTVSLISGCGGASDKGQKEAVKEAEGTGTLFGGTQRLPKGSVRYHSVLPPIMFSLS